MSTMIFNLDSTYSSSDNEHIEEWRKQVRSNEDWMREHLPASGFSEEAVKHFVEGCCFSKRAAIAEFELAGCKAYGTVKQDSSGSIDTNLYLVTPEAFYAGQGVSLYQSGRDPRFEDLTNEMFKAMDVSHRTTEEIVATREEFRNKETSLKETVWQEQVDKLFGMV